MEDSRGRVSHEKRSMERFISALVLLGSVGLFGGPSQVWGQNEPPMGSTLTPSQLSWDRETVPTGQGLGEPGSATPRADLPYLVEPNQPLPTRDATLLGNEAQREVLDIEPAPLPKVIVDFYQDSQSAYRIYRSDESRLGFISSGSGELGWTSIESNYYSRRDNADDFNLGTAHHWLSGPSTPDLPARVHDFVFGYQRRRTIADRFSYDLATSVGVYSDFEGSARQGVRFVSHAVGIVHANSLLDFVFGVDYLDRDDIKILPVIGWSWHDPEVAPIRFDLVFPRPRLEYVIDPQHRIFVQGQLGGGTWDIEFPDESDDVMTYRDYRVLFGLESLSTDGEYHAIEFGYVFQRQMELRDRLISADYSDSFVVQFTTRR